MLSAFIFRRIGNKEAFCHTGSVWNSGKASASFFQALWPTWSRMKTRLVTFTFSVTHEDSWHTTVLLSALSLTSRRRDHRANIRALRIPGNILGHGSSGELIHSASDRRSSLPGSSLAAWPCYGVCPPLCTALLSTPFFEEQRWPLSIALSPPNVADRIKSRHRLGFPLCFLLSPTSILCWTHYLPNMTFTSVPRFTSNPCYQLAQEDTPRSQVSAAKAKKAATFGALSVCANRRLPSRVSIRSCTVNICPSVRGGDRLRTPWTFNPRMRSSQARVERFSTSRARSIRIPTASSAIPSADFQRLGDPPRLNASASVPQGLSSVAPDLTSPSLLSTSGPLPVVSTLGRPSPSESRHPSLMARARRSPSSSRYPEMHVNSSATEYTVDISLPIAIKSEMVTISTARGGKVKIVADAWHLEVDCHFEWEIVFPPHDVDLASIRANFEKGRLVVSAGRRSCKA